MDKNAIEPYAVYVYAYFDGCIDFEVVVKRRKLIGALDHMETRAICGFRLGNRQGTGKESASGIPEFLPTRCPFLNDFCICSGTENTSRKRSAVETD